MTAKPILYSYYHCSCAWRVRFALAFKGIEHEIIPINLWDDEQHSDWYKKINPMSQVPALSIDGHTLVQSVSILQYLEETRPEPSLFGDKKDPYSRAVIREICETVNSGIQPLQNYLFTIVGDETKQKEFRKNIIAKGFAAVEEMLDKTASKFSVGDTPTIADFYLMPQVYNARLYDVDLTKFPIISRVVAAIETLDVYKASAPSTQPDYRPPAIV